MQPSNSLFRRSLFQLLVTVGSLFLSQVVNAAPLITKDLFYGEDPSRADFELQTLDVYHQADAVKQPVIVYVHGGGWAFGDKSEVNHKADYFTSMGFVFISMNYRLRWDHKLFDQLQDIVKVVDWVHQNADTYGMDSNRIVLMGHEAGGHLVSLIGSDPRHLKSGDYGIADIAAIVSIDSVSYDIPRVHKELGSFVERRQHRLVFGENEQIQRESSPVHHVRQRSSVQLAKPIAGASGIHKTELPAFALLYTADNEATRLQAQGFAKVLTDASVSIVVIPSSADSKRDLNVEIGAKGHVPTGALMAFLRASS